MRLLILLVGLMLFNCTPKLSPNSSRIQPNVEHPRFWHYKNEPVFLLGSTTDDNLFQHEDVEQKLDALVAAGGNYIRCTLSSRDSGNVKPFLQTADGRDDLDQWNPVFWERLQRCLQACYERDIIVQIELWAFHDFNQKPGEPAWNDNPWNAFNNINYDTMQTHLRGNVGHIGKTPHAFFLSAPKINNDVVLLEYQKQFVDKVLEIALPHPNVLFCMTNEIHPIYPPEWGWFWSDHVRARAAEQSLTVHCTEMYWQVDFTHPQHDDSYLHPETYSFFEASQSSFQKRDEHWRHLGAAYQRLARKPRPMNNVKIYGADSGPDWSGSDRDGLERFWRSILGGAAGCRLHRPPYGLGGSTAGSIHLTAARQLLERYDIFQSIPDFEHKHLENRESNEAFCATIPGLAVAVFFPQTGAIMLNNIDLGENVRIQWLDINHTRWYMPQVEETHNGVSLKTPGEGYWIALVEKMVN